MPPIQLILFPIHMQKQSCENNLELRYVLEIEMSCTVAIIQVNTVVEINSRVAERKINNLFPRAKFGKLIKTATATRK